MRKNKIYEDIAVDDVIIQDPNIANQIVQVQKQINDRLKRSAQLNSEIATFKQQIGALKDRAIQAQKAQMTTANKKVETPAPESNATPVVQAESYVPSLEEFLNEEEPRFVPHFENPAGTVYMDGKPRFQKYKKKVEREFTDKDWEKYGNIDKKIQPVQFQIDDLEDELEILLNSKQETEFQMDNLAGQEGMEVMELLSSGISGKEKMQKFFEMGYTASEFRSLQSELDGINKFQEEFETKKYEIEGNIKKAKKELEGIELEQEDIGVSYKDDYMPVKIMESLYEEDEEFDEDEKDDDLFFVQIPPQTEIDGEIIAKVFREDNNSSWYVRDVEDQAEFLDELVFQKNYTKPEIIGYLASIFGDVLEINQEEFEDLIDDKEELDDKYFPDRENKTNVRSKLRK